MSRRYAMGLAAAVAGCAGSSAPSVAPAPTCPPSASAVATPPDAAADVEAGAPRAAVNPCFPDGAPPVLPAGPTPGGAGGSDACNGVTYATRRADERAVAADVKKRYTASVRGGTPEVAFTCDTAGNGDVIEVVLEDVDLNSRQDRGSSMVLWTLQRSLTGDYDARGVDESGTSFASGKVPAADAEKAIERTRAALTATVREVAPKPRDEGASGFGTNRRLGLRVRVRGADGTLERAFEGQVGSFLQERRIPLQIAAEALHALVDHFEWRAHAATDEERRAFVDRFLENEPRFRDGTARGTIATYLGAAVGMRARDLAPALLRMLASPAAAPVAHEWDLRASLLGALAALTPWDARTGADGGKLSDAEAAAAYVKQCGVTATAP